MTKSINQNLKKGRFIKLKIGDKKPHGIGDWNEKTFSYEESKKFIDEKYNIGLVCDKNIICIDADCPESVKYCDRELPITYTEETCSRGGRHYFYVPDDDIKNTLIGKDKGEIRCSRQYVVVAPSIALNKQGVQKDYTVVRNISLAHIKQEVVDRLITHFSDIDLKITADTLVQNKVTKTHLEDEVFKKISTYIKTLITTNHTKEELKELGFPSRSERDMKVVTYLLNNDLGEYIFSIFDFFPCGNKYRDHSSPNRYLKKTIEGGIKFLGLRTKGDMELERTIELTNPQWLKRQLDSILTKIERVKDKGNLFKESLIATLAFRIKMSQIKLEKRLTQLIEENTPKQILTLFELSNLPMIQQEFWVDPLIPKGTIIMLGAKPGEGKSLLVQGLATSILTTGQFLDYKSIGLPKILIYSIDDSSEKMLQSRHHFISNGLKTRSNYIAENLTNCVTCFQFNKNNLLKEMEFALKYDIIILDSYRRVLSGTENDSDITDAFFNDFLKPLKEAGKTLIILHHLRKTNMEDIDDTELMDVLRGSSDIAAQLDLAYILKTSMPLGQGMIEEKDCFLKVCKNRLGIPFKDLNGNTTHTICYRVIKDSTKTSTTFNYMDPGQMKSTKERRQDRVKLLIREKGVLTTTQLIDIITKEFSCSEITISKDLTNMTRNGELVKEKYGSYNLPSLSDDSS